MVAMRGVRLFPIEAEFQRNPSMRERKGIEMFKDKMKTDVVL